MNTHNIQLNRVAANATLTGLMIVHGELQDSLYRASRNSEGVMAELAEFRLIQIDKLVGELLTAFPDATTWPIEVGAIR